MKRILRWAAWYLSTDVAVGIETGKHQVARVDPGFDPLFRAIVAVFAWPVVLAWDPQSLTAHDLGAPRP